VTSKKRGQLFFDFGRTTSISLLIMKWMSTFSKKKNQII
jgi:hypothetical protein